MSVSSLFDELKADAPGIEWPNVLTGQTASLFSALYGLGRTERLAPEDLARLRDAQLDRLLRHATAEVPFYSDRVRKAGYRAGKTPVAAIWDAIPILTRIEVQEAGERMRAKSFPKTHGSARERTTSGSTSQPVRIITTDLTDFHWQCVNLRDRAWHDIDLGGTLALVTDGALKMAGRPVVEQGSWSLPATSLRRPGKQFKINPSLEIAEQVRAIRRIDPTYIQTRPSQLNLILKQCEASGERFRQLRAVFCISESVTDALRETCLALLGAPIIECYSCAELGYMALQCPVSGQLHVQSEFVHLEVIGRDGAPCQPGESGRVVVTSLHNYAMSLIRYEVGDEAVVGQPCACGRGLPVLARLLGRTHDYLKLRSGESVRADIRHYAIARMPDIVEFQIVQPALGRIEVRLVARRRLSTEETDHLKNMLARHGDEIFEVTIVYRDAIERAASGKLRTFICEVA